MTAQIKSETITNKSASPNTTAPSPNPTVACHGPRKADSPRPSRSIFPTSDPGRPRRRAGPESTHGEPANRHDRSGRSGEGGRTMNPRSRIDADTEVDARDLFSDGDAGLRTTASFPSRFPSSRSRPKSVKQDFQSPERAPPLSGAAKTMASAQTTSLSAGATYSRRIRNIAS